MTAPGGSLSITLQEVAKDLPDRCTAGMVVSMIHARHANYARREAHLIAPPSQVWPAETRTQPAYAWYEEARRFLRSNLVELSGRTAILGLALTDFTLGREIVRIGLFARLLAEISEGFRLFSDSGRRRLAAIPRAWPTGVSPAGVLRPAAVGGGRGALSPDGARMLSYGLRRSGGTTTTVWNVASGQPIGVYEASRPIRMARFSADGSHLLALGDGGSLLRWRVGSPGSPDVVCDAIPGFASAALSTDGRLVVARLSGPGLVVFDVDTREARSVPTPQVKRVAVSSDGTWVGALSGDLVSIYPIGPDHHSTQQQTVEIKSHPDVRSFDVGSGYVALSAGSGLVVLPPNAHESDSNPIFPESRQVSINADASLVASVGPAGVTLVHPRAMAVLGTLPTGGDVDRVTFSLDGSRLLTTHYDGTLRVWDVGLTLPPQPEPGWLAGFDSDVAGDDRDFLDRQRDVEAFASLIAARDVRPPLSIGVFGDWGSGKSWFMDRLKRRVDFLATTARASDARQADVAYFQRIAQVHFNAWHYAEEDVLSSLVDHVFTRLDLGGQPAGLVERDIIRVKTELAQANDAVRTAEQELGAAKKSLDVAVTDREEREQERAVRVQELRTGAAQKVIGESALNKGREVLEEIGWGDVPKAAGDLLDAVRSGRDTLSRANAVFAPLVNGQADEVAKKRLTVALLVCLIPILVLLIGTVVALVLRTSWPGLLGTGAFVAALLGGITKVVVSGAHWVRDELDELQAADRAIEAAIQAALAPLDDQIVDARKKEQDAGQAVVDRRSDLANASADVAEKREELMAAGRPAKLLEDLIGARIRGGDYSSRLGVVAMARRDFESVSELIQAANDAALQADPTAPTQGGIEVNRIVLYIDDLDRCEPAKVAIILQAVHLLLAFPLFVVVVGVDPRWVGRALRKHYPELLDGDEVDPNDYLEKIFQIPFWLPRLDVDRTATMLKGLSAGGVASQGPGSVQPDSERPGTDAVEDGDDETQGGNSGGRFKAESAGSASENSPKEASRPVFGTTDPPPDVNPRGLLFEPQEVRAMADLAPLLGRSPRSLKRFVNVYRLIKVRQPDVEDFVDDSRDDAGYRIVLYLLAEVTGRPQAAEGVFDAIRRSPDGELLAGIPDGWPRAAGVYKPWLTAIAPFSFHPLDRVRVPTGSE